MKKSIYLSLFLSIYLSISLNGQVINSNELEKGTSIQRNASFNVDEIKVRWKKAALENCPGVPCVVVPSSCPTSTILDVDNNVYNTVSIGTQCWTKENLKVTKYSDGTAIPLNNTYTSGTVSTVWQGLTTGAYTIYGNEASSGANATNYGFLYNWYAAKGIATPGSTTYKNLCPSGYHVPTDSDWNKLVKFIHSGADTSATSGNQSTTAGGKMKSTSTTLWGPTNIGADNSSGFSGLPGGYRWSDGSFLFIRDRVFFWSATEYDGTNAWSRFLEEFNGNVNRSKFYKKSMGKSVRCLMD
jgi:uncharacterized protein (TIGR02145 family)